MDDVRAAAAAAGIAPEQVLENMAADLERSTDPGRTSVGVDPATGTDLEALLRTGVVEPTWILGGTG